jgi:hypothetical protein
MFALGGCGGGSDGGGGATTAAGAPTTAATSPAPPPTATTSTPTPTATTPAPKPPPTTPQQAPGEGDGTGGGGTEPARTELTFTATSSGISPKQAGVAPYISVRVSLVSKDGSAHKLVIDGKTLSVGATSKSAFVTLPGLRPGKSYRGTADGNTTIRILSTSEPGP